MLGLEALFCSMLTLLVLDTCASSPCANGATCITGIGIFYCHCVDGFSGIYCNLTSQRM